MLSAHRHPSIFSQAEHRSMNLRLLWQLLLLAGFSARPAWAETRYELSERQAPHAAVLSLALPDDRGWVQALPVDEYMIGYFLARESPLVEIEVLAEPLEHTLSPEHLPKELSSDFLYSPQFMAQLKNFYARQLSEVSTLSKVTIDGRNALRFTASNTRNLYGIGSQESIEMLCYLRGDRLVLLKFMDGAMRANGQPLHSGRPGYYESIIRSLRLH